METEVTTPKQGTPTALRDKLDGIYAKAFAKAPKPVEFARLMAEAKQVYDQMKKADKSLPHFTVDVAAKTSLHIKTVQRLVVRGNIEPEILDQVAADKRLNKGFILDRIAKEDGVEQATKLEAVRADLLKGKANTDADRAGAFLNQFDKLSEAVRRIVLSGLKAKLKGVA